MTTLFIIGAVLVYTIAVFIGSRAVFRKNPDLLGDTRTLSDKAKQKLKNKINEIL